MSTAAQLFTTLGISEPHIIINPDRSVSVPDELKAIAVQYDHNIETVTFDCPRYWDEHDLSALSLYINYEGPDRHLGASAVENLKVDETDENTIHFDWTIKRNITIVPGKIEFLVCAQKPNDDGTIEQCWHSRLCKDLEVLEGLECGHGESGDTIIPDNYDLSDVIFCFDSDDDDYIPIPGEGTSASIMATDDGEGNVTIQFI